MGPRNYLVSGDVHGLAAQFLEKYLEGGVVAPSLCRRIRATSTPGSASCRSSTRKRAGFPEAVLMGTMLGEEVVHVLDGIKKPCPAGPIKTVFKTLTLPHEAAREDQGGGRRRSRRSSTSRWAEWATWPWSASAARPSTRSAGGIKAASPFPRTLIITHCNGAAGYLPTKDAYPQGGYEVQSSHFAAGAAEQIVEEAVRLLHSIASTTVDERAKPIKPLYHDAAQPIECRVDDLLGRMTLEEKVGQINMPCVYEQRAGQDYPGKDRGRAEVRRGHSYRGLRSGRRFLHALQRDPARRPAAAGRVPQPPATDRRRHAVGHSPLAERRGHARPDVPRRHDLPGRPGFGQHLEHGTAWAASMPPWPARPAPSAFTRTSRS